MKKVISILRAHKIQPTPQRIATARAVLNTKLHPSADEIWEKVKRECPTVSRATVYNTLNLLVDQGVSKTTLPSLRICVFNTPLSTRRLRVL